MGESGVDNSLFWSQVSILRDCYLQYTKFMSLSKKESVNVIGPIPVHAAGKQGENKERQSP